MRGVNQLQLSESQKKRLSRAKEGFKDARGNIHTSAFVNIGDTIAVDHEAGFLRGHGTQLVNGELLATVCGVIERLTSSSPYNAETGDVVVGRIMEVAPKRWKVDVKSRQDAMLMLSAVNLPGGIQRRRTNVDELNMRAFFEEKDLISAEVQTVNQDGAIHLHTRSLKYGKLENGQLLSVPPYLIKRLRQHFHQLKNYGVEMIIGCNGNIWSSAPSEAPKTEKLSGFSEEKEAKDVPKDLREKICRLANSIRVLSSLGLFIHPESILDTFEYSLKLNVESRDMLGAEFLVKVAEKEVERRNKEM